MKFNSTHFLLIITALILIFIITIFIYIINADYSNNVPSERPNLHKRALSTKKFLFNIDKKNIKQTFPYNKYLDSCDRFDIKSIRNDLSILYSMDSVNFMEYQKAISIALCDSLAYRMKLVLNKYEPDSLIRLIQWVEKFHAYGDIDQQNLNMYEAIYGYWLNLISNKLSDYYKERPSIKYDFKYRYIVCRCIEKQFNSSISNSNFEKVIIYFIEKNWTYLFNKFWNSTSILYKSVVSLIFIFILFPYVYIFICNRKRKKTGK